MESFNVFYAAQFFHACAFSKVPLYSAFSSTLHILTHLSAISLLMHISPFPTIISISQGQSLGSCGCRSCCQDLSKPDTTGRTQRGLWDPAGSSWVSPCFSSFEGAFHWRRGAALSQPTRWGTLTWHPMIQIYQIYNISIYIYILCANFIVWMQQHIPFHTLFKDLKLRFLRFMILMLQYCIHLWIHTGSQLYNWIGSDPETHQETLCADCKGFPKRRKPWWQLYKLEFQKLRGVQNGRLHCTQLRCDCICGQVLLRPEWLARKTACNRGVEVNGRGGLRTELEQFPCALSRKKGAVKNSKESGKYLNIESS